MISPPWGEPTTWSRRFAVGQGMDSGRWAVARGDAARQERFLSWLATRAHRVVSIDHWAFGGLKVMVEKPTKVGIDRLLTALAARRMAPAERPVLIVNVGTAMTIDLVD